MTVFELALNYLKPRDKGAMMMWMDSYLAETLIRDQIAEAWRQGQRRHLLRSLKSPPRRRRYRAVMQQLMESVSVAWMKALSSVPRVRTSDAGAAVCHENPPR